MSRLTTPQQTSTSEALRNAEQRAEAAERRADQLEQRLEALEQSRFSQQTHQHPERTLEPDAPSAPLDENEANDALSALRNEPMMDHLLNALDSGQDIGHYGRLVFAMVAHHFLPEETMLQWLTRDPGTNPEEAAALLRQVEGRDYNPPRRERILAWQSEQQFPILPNPDDPDCGNVYRNLKFPQKVYDHIQEYQEEKVQAE
ncbi:hypothetical protein [Occallatibacter savannae]|uniref:hypothetical protein n=1 Tax=Occallatibacter savannae TaxID=1002691 RepID=UPI00194E7E27|nr:hypothetical protein [Occallatibacter savannae]